VRPSPIPPRFISLDLAICPKNLKSLAKSSSYIPIPVSLIEEIRKLSTKSIVTVRLPEKVNFAAFPIKLNSTCLKRFKSVIILLGTDGDIFKFNSKFFDVS
jgi:hypothetical protein